AMAHSVQGIIERRTGNYVSSIENYMQSKVLYEELNDSINISSLLHNVGMVHRYLKEYRKSISYYKEAIELKNYMPNQSYEIACSYNMMGVSYKKIKKRDSALWCYEKAIQLFTKIGKEEDVYRVKANMGVLFSDQKKYDQAMVLYKEGLWYNKKNNNIISLANSYYNLSTLYKRLKKYELSMIYVDSSIVIATKEGLKERRSLGLLRKSFLYKKSGNYEQAYEFYRKFNRASDSIHNIDNIKKIQELELNYVFKQEKL
ncbi:MAG: tetratricopeptide repeat protein, partial [Flavobacteriaceae bacterium]|nr:tetratricopeptide repeat protein [Flavobacteriaceae bacterium]